VPYLHALAFALIAAGSAVAAPIPALIVDGRNNHDWKNTTPVMKSHLEETGVFQVNVSTAPPEGADLAAWSPEFSKYRVVIFNYTDYPKAVEWPEPLKTAFIDYVAKGGGLVIVHATSSAFPGWKEFEDMIGLGGWGGRDEKSGPLIRWRDGKIVRDMSPKKAGHHGKQHEFAVTTREPGHPIMKGLPAAWMHEKDELYDSLRGPAQNMTVLATAFCDTAQGGTGEHEPALWVVRYGKGRIFHTILGHGPEAMRGNGFAVTLARGAEWAATGKVKQPVNKELRQVP
jgi:hypothetical protein